MQRLFFFFLCCLLFSTASAQDKYVQLAEQKFPVAYDVDVLIVGGTTGDVAAAVESAKAGAKTMLITDRPYLGGDITATLQLWLEPEEKTDDPLAAAIFTDPNRGQPAPIALAILKAQKQIPFTYKVLEPISSKHPDTPQKDRLIDGKASDAPSESIQIDGDATVILDLKHPQEVGAVGLVGFYRIDDFAIDKVIVSASTDNKNWKPAGVAEADKGNTRTLDAPDQFMLTLDKPVETQYLKIEVKKTGASTRVLLGEIVVLPDKKLVPAAETYKPAAGEKYTRPAPRPMHVKTVLDKALEDAGVKSLIWTYAVGKLVDKDNNRYGILISNRAGTQAILAKKVVHTSKIIRSKEKADNTAVWAEYVVIGGEPQKNIDTAKYPLLKKYSVETVGEPFYSGFPNPAKTKSGVHPVIRYTFEIAAEPAIVSPNSPAAFAARNAVENQIRLAAFDSDQQFTSDTLVFLGQGDKKLTTTQFIAEGRIAGKKAAEEAKSVKKLPLEQLTAVHWTGKPAEKPQTISGEIKETEGNIKAFKEPLGYVKQAAERPARRRALPPDGRGRKRWFWNICTNSAVSERQVPFQRTTGVTASDSVRKSKAEKPRGISNSGFNGGGRNCSKPVPIFGTVSSAAVL
jgi:hypothetical protein